MTRGEGFELFDAGHLLALATVAALVWGAARLGRRQPGPWPAWLLAAALLAQEGAKQVVFVGLLGQDWQRSLPLDLCRINELLCVVMLLARSYRAFEVAYFWSMAGSVTAMLTPALTAAFPHPLFVLFFLGHGLVVIAVAYAMTAYGFRPRRRSLPVALGVTAAYALAIAPLNLLLDANYLFLRHKPPSPTLFDLFGPWPVYLPVLFGIAALLCVLWWLPFARRRS